MPARAARVPAVRGMCMVIYQVVYQIIHRIVRQVIRRIIFRTILQILIGIIARFIKFFHISFPLFHSTSLLFCRKIP